MQPGFIISGMVSAPVKIIGENGDIKELRHPKAAKLAEVTCFNTTNL